MVPFLGQVAAHYLEAPDVEQTCFVFPNRRSMVFFRKHLGDLVRERGGGRPLLVPPMFTISDFFARVCGREPADRLRLLTELYPCYRELNPQAESLDEFIFWGDVLLQDFSDIDKYLVDAGALLRNVSDFKSLDDRFEYLSEEQRSAISRFLAHFREGKGAVKARFVQLWNLLHPLYTLFRKKLQEKGLAYEGMVYRDLADRVAGGASVRDLLSPAFPEVKHFVFVGLNALTSCERLVLLRMRDASLASFVWDFVSPWIRDKHNKASFFMRQNVREFPQAFPLDPDGLPEPDIRVVSVPSATGQTKLAPQILSACPGNPVETAFVLPDETLLLPLLNAIPSQYDSINVTMGYPMTGSAVYTLLQALGQMQLRQRRRDGRIYFYHRPVGEVLTSGLFPLLLSPEESDRVERVKAEGKYYIPQEDLTGGPMLDLLFRPVVEAPGEADPAQNHALEQYFSDILAHIGSALGSAGDMLLELDFAKRCHTQLNILSALDLPVLPQTWLKLLQRILEGISVPFRGEPLQGLQVMGPLETRALDFRNLIILSANEGVFPRREAHASFIPPELRKGFGLPTHEYQDAVWAYYFYRMIQRAEHVWLLVDSRTEGLKNGEESRYVKQLEYHFGARLTRLSAAAPVSPVPSEECIPKTEEHIRIIREKPLSASSLQAYLSCPVKFFYMAVEGLKTRTDVAESLDAGMLGTVFHHIMQRLYGKKFISREDIAGFRKDKSRLKALIREEVLAQMNSIEVSGRNLVLEKILLEYVLSTLRHDAALLEREGSPGFRILGLEQYMECSFDGFRIHGIVDRIDSYREGEVRIVDYKTGKVEENDILIRDDNAAQVVEKLFGPTNNKRPKIALQLYIYDLFARENPSLKGKTLLNAIYSTSRLFTGEGLPDVPVSPEFTRLAGERLSEMLNGMTDPAIPFTRTAEKKTCEFCDFKTLCGR